MFARTHSLTHSSRALVLTFHFTLNHTVINAFYKSYLIGKVELSVARALLCDSVQCTRGGVHYLPLLRMAPRRRFRYILPSW